MNTLKALLYDNRNTTMTKPHVEGLDGLPSEVRAAVEAFIADLDLPEGVRFKVTRFESGVSDVTKELTGLLAPIEAKLELSEELDYTIAAVKSGMSLVGHLTRLTARINAEAPLPESLKETVLTTAQTVAISLNSLIRRAQSARKQLVALDASLDTKLATVPTELAIPGNYDHVAVIFPAPKPADAEQPKS